MFCLFCLWWNAIVNPNPTPQAAIIFYLICRYISENVTFLSSQILYFHSDKKGHSCYLLL